MASERYIVIPNWERHQHYKDQSRPAWIKLHTSLLHDDGWLELSPGQRSALVSIWLLYASTRRRVTFDARSLSRQIGQRVTKQTLDSLRDAGFIEVCSRDALDELYARLDKSREEISLRDQRAARGATAERDIHRGKGKTRGNGWVDNLGQYTGCRYVRGEYAVMPKYDPLGTEPPPFDWPHPRPTKDEILEALSA